MRAHIDDVQHEVLARHHGRSVVRPHCHNDRVPLPVMRVWVLQQIMSSGSSRLLCMQGLIRMGHRARSPARTSSTAWRDLADTTGRGSRKIHRWH